jgi:hypothetical protein
MMTRRWLLGVLGCAVAAKPSDARPPDSAGVGVAALTVRIVPTDFEEETGRVIAMNRPSQHFYVVATNVSGQSIRLWREWYSWGYFNLTFQVTGQEGGPVEVRKVDREWTRNFPDWEIIPPGGNQVREVTFDPTTWEGLPLPEAHRSRVVRIRAIYDIQQDEETKRHGIWTGRVSSPEDSYEIRR